MQRAELCRELNARGMPATAVIVADDENLEIAEEFGFVAVPAPNDHLGRKFNDGYEVACRELEADVVVHIGSDDWVHPSVFDRLPRADVGIALPTPEAPAVVGRPGPEIQICRQIALVDLLSGRMSLCRSDRRAGVIPWLLPRAALEPSGFRPLPDEQKIGIDGALLRGIGRSARLVVHDPHPLSCVDFKSETNLNAFDAIAGALGGVSYDRAWDALEWGYGKELAAQAQLVAAVTA